MRLARLVMVLVLGLGCTESALKAQEPIWGKQQCAHCAMLVSEKPPASQAVTADGKRRFFDDLGCMVAWEEREGTKVSARWVRDQGGSWVDPTQVKFSAGHSTPMDFGFLADAQGTVSWEAVRAAVLAKSRGGADPHAPGAGGEMGHPK